MMNLPNEKEEIRLLLDSINEPLLLNHISNLLNSGVLVISGKVEQDTEGGDLTTSLDNV